MKFDVTLFDKRFEKFTLKKKSTQEKLSPKRLQLVLVYEATIRNENFGNRSSYQKMANKPDFIGFARRTATTNCAFELDLVFAVIENHTAFQSRVFSQEFPRPVDNVVGGCRLVWIIFFA